MKKNHLNIDRIHKILKRALIIFNKSENLFIESNNIDDMRSSIKTLLLLNNYNNLWDSIINTIGTKILKKATTKVTINRVLIITLVLLNNLMLGFLLSTLFNEFNLVRIELIPLEIILVLLSIFFVIAYQLYSDRIVNEFRTFFVDEINNTEGIISIGKWFNANQNHGYPIVIGTVFCVFWILFAPYFVNYSKGSFLGYGTLLSTSLNIFPIGTAIYYLILILRFPFTLKKCSFHIYTIDPSSSYLIHKLSALLSKSTIIVGILAAITTLAFSTSGLMNIIGIILIVAIGWIPLVVIFCANQYSLSNIIVDSKWKKIQKIQNTITELENDNNIAFKEKMKKLKLLIDFHNQTKTTPNSMINIKTIAELFDSLILPIIALLIANLQVIVSILK
jgi:hypothetical protein